VYSQTKIAFNRLRRKVAPTGVFLINESSLTIKMPNGSIIRFRSAEKPDNLYGDDVHSIVFDEAPRARVEAWYALRSTITATKGEIKMIGNFGGASNWMHILKNKAKTDENYEYYKVNAYDGVKEGILDEDEIEQAKKDLPDRVFKQLYLAVESENEDQLIPYKTIRSMYSNDFVSGGTKYITADIALQGSDNFVLIVWDGWRIIDVDIIAKIESDELVKRIRDKARHHKVQQHNICFDADGIGSYIRGQIKRAAPFHNGGKPIKEKGAKVNYKNLKSQCGYGFARIANEVGIFIAENVVSESLLVEELEQLQSYKTDQEGKMQLKPKKEIKKSIGRSPDLLDALMMRYYFELKPQTRVRKTTLI